MRNSAYLIDASIYVFRAWFSIPDSMRGEGGKPINAAYGFCRFLTEFVEKSNAEYVGIAFDESLTQSFRNDLYPEYKMNRELPPQELKDQFAICRRMAEAAGFYCVGSDRYEADDLIATMAGEMRKQSFRNVIVSGDKDLSQILRGDDFWWDFARNQQLDAAKVKDKFGVGPEVIQDYLGLCGDAVDNIPGVPGIGPKTASALLDHFGDLETMLGRVNEIAYLKIRGAKSVYEKLYRHADQAKLSKELATVAYDAPIEVSPELLRRRCAERKTLSEIGQIMGGRGEGLFDRLAASAMTLRS